MDSKYLKLIAILLVGLWLGSFLADHINLTTADLGRHLKSGELISRNLLSGDWAEARQILRTNYFSSTQTDYPFINHHWLSGVILFGVFKLVGFTGVAWFYLLLLLTAFGLFWRVATQSSNFWISSIAALLLIPLIAAREEVRPEAFSYLFAGLFLWLLWEYTRRSARGRWLWLLPIIQILWVNTHIYFVIGPAILGAFTAEALLRRDWALIKSLAVGLLLVLLACLLNPYGLSGLTYPLQIFDDYGYRVVENQSIRFLENLNFTDPNFLLYKLAALLIAGSITLILWRNRKDISVPLNGMGLIFLVLGGLAIRNFTWLGLFALPLLSYNLSRIINKDKLPQTAAAAAPWAGIVLLLTLITHQSALVWNRPQAGLGLLSANNGSAEFFQAQELAGPIFNNYDIGSYLILHLFPAERVFVDNRPEAYSADFLQQTYIGSQENEEQWQALDRAYRFNVIYFSWRDYTPWSQNFLIKRVWDSQWAAVFVDDYAIIFLKRSENNAELIKQFEIPKENFSIGINLTDYGLAGNGSSQGKNYSASAETHMTN